MAASYADIRHLISDGDLIAVKSRRGLLPWLTRIMTGSPWTHTGVAVWLDGGLWLAEINAGGNHLVPMSQIDQPADVCACPAAPDAVRHAIFASLRQRKDYGYLELARIAIYRLTGLQIVRLTGGEVCNQYAARVYHAAGAALSLPPIAAPDDLVLALLRKTGWQ